MAVNRIQTYLAHVTVLYISKIRAGHEPCYIQILKICVSLTQFLKRLPYDTAQIHMEFYKYGKDTFLVRIIMLVEAYVRFYKQKRGNRMNLLLRATTEINLSSDLQQRECYCESYIRLSTSHYITRENFGADCHCALLIFVRGTHL